MNEKFLYKFCLVTALTIGPAEAALIGVNTPNTTVINEGDSLTTTFGSQTPAGAFHLGSGSMSYSPGSSDAVFISGTTSVTFVHYALGSMGSNVFQYRQDGIFTTLASGSGTQHYYVPPSLHGQSWSGTISAANTIAVLNVAPTITSLTGAGSYDINEVFFFSATATDPGVLDLLTFNWDLDDDGTYDDFVGSSGSWSYASAGARTIGLQVLDGDGGVVDGFFDVNVDGAPSNGIHEPATFALVSVGILGFGFRRRNKIVGNSDPVDRQSLEA